MQRVFINLRINNLHLVCRRICFVEESAKIGGVEGEGLAVLTRERGGEKETRVCLFVCLSAGVLDSV